jgi:hypothetical protein
MLDLRNEYDFEIHLLLILRLISPFAMVLQILGLSGWFFFFFFKKFFGKSIGSVLFFILCLITCIRVFNCVVLLMGMFNFSVFYNFVCVPFFFSVACLLVL